MKRNTIGEFEELVLLAIGILLDDAYGLAIMDELENRTNRTVLISSVHKTLVRLEEKGMVQSAMGGKTAERGGRAKKLYTLTADGKEVLQHVRSLRNTMWEAIPEGLWK